MTLKGMQEQVLNQQMSDNFEVLKKLGQGGFGTVWLCRRTTSAARARFYAFLYAEYSCICVYR
jgi:serine/threonine protein kinase